MTRMNTAPVEPANEAAYRIGRLFESLARANEALHKAKSQEQNARSRTTECINVVNRMQKGIDVELDKQRKQAAGGTDWRTSQR